MANLFRPSLETDDQAPDGWRGLRAGDVASFPAGEAGAHQVANFSDGDADVLLVSEMSPASIAVYRRVGA